MNKKESNVQQENIKELLNLIQENPNLRIVPLVASEIVADDSHCWWCGSWGNAEIDEIYVSDERAYLKSLDFEDLVEEYIDLYDEGHPTNEEHIEKWAEDKVANLAWERVIIVNINTP